MTLSRHCWRVLKNSLFDLPLAPWRFHPVWLTSAPNPPRSLQPPRMTSWWNVVPCAFAYFRLHRLPNYDDAAFNLSWDTLLKRVHQKINSNFGNPVLFLPLWIKNNFGWILLHGHTRPSTSAKLLTWWLEQSPGFNPVLNLVPFTSIDLARSAGISRTKLFWTTFGLLFSDPFRYHQWYRHGKVATTYVICVGWLVIVISFFFIFYFQQNFFF